MYDKESFFETIEPGQIRSFEIQTKIEKDDYDQIFIRAVGRFEPFILEVVEDWNAVVGDLELIEDSVHFVIGTDLLGRKYVGAYGEVVNKTNAAITNLSVYMDLTDTSLGVVSA